MKLKALLALASIGMFALVGCDGTPTSGKSTSKKVYVQSLNIAFSNATSKDGFDAYCEPSDSLELTWTANPENASEYDVSWSMTDATVCGIVNEGNNKATFTARDEGETTIYAYTYGKDSVMIKSNELKVKVYSNVKRNADFQYAKTTYTNNSKEYDLNVNTLYKNQGAPHQDPLGENHCLVVPFGFSDLTEKQDKATIEKIKLTFFGTEEELKKVGGQNSLANFYNTSSYGKVKFEGVVLPEWCVYNGTVSQFENASGGQLGAYAAEYARNYYRTEYAKANHGALGADAKPLTYFDANNDGYIDLVWIVYSQRTVGTESWWAYVTYTGNRADITNPTVNTLGFASIDWMNKGCGGYDFHTYTHETGHTYGLPDYYDYNSQWKPMGGIDFMDQNFGDHNCFSKFSLGWTKPLVVNDSAIITLRPGTTTGDCFIIPSPGYNGTAFDEYMMFELMAPIGLCKEYKDGYENTSGYTVPGIRITHVDSRVYKGSHDSYLVNNPEEGIDVRLGNSYAGRSGIKVDGDYYPVEQSGGKVKKNYMTQLSLMESVIKEQNWTNTATYNADNGTLFTAGQAWSLSPKRKWAATYMPSTTNLWNKAKTITGWSSKDTQTYTIDKTCTFNYTVEVLSIKEDTDAAYVATVKVTANAY